MMVKVKKQPTSTFSIYRYSDWKTANIGCLDQKVANVGSKQKTATGDVDKQTLDNSRVFWATISNIWVNQI